VVPLKLSLKKKADLEKFELKYGQCYFLRIFHILSSVESKNISDISLALNFGFKNLIHLKVVPLLFILQRD
jgi:hypothetical protein